MGASPCTCWIGDTLDTDEGDFGSVFTSVALGGTVLETSVPGLVAAGGIRSGSIK